MGYMWVHGAHKRSKSQLGYLECRPIKTEKGLGSDQDVAGCPADEVMVHVKSSW